MPLNYFKIVLAMCVCCGILILGGERSMKTLTVTKEGIMTKKEAINQLVSDFHNILITRGFNSIDEIEDDLDKEMAIALKVKFN